MDTGSEQPNAAKLAWGTGRVTTRPELSGHCLFTAIPEQLG